MKRIAIWSCVAILLAVGGVAIAAANGRGWTGCFGHRGGRFGAMGYVVHELNLNEEQKQQIRSMWKTERTAVSGLLQEFAAESKQMDQATAKGNVDEGKVQQIATQQGATVAKLLVEEEHFKAKIYASVLSPEQRVKADELQARWQGRLGHIARGME